MYNFEKVDVTKFFQYGRSIFVKTRKEAQELTKYRGYYYEVFDEKNLIGYGIPK